MKKEERPKVFSTSDPLNRNVILYADTLEKHIMERHYTTYDKSQVVDDIKSTVEKPEKIYYDKYIDIREVFIKESSHVSDFTFVVVEYKDDNTGIIATSYPVNKKKLGRQMKNAKKKYPKDEN